MKATAWESNNETLSYQDSLLLYNIKIDRYLGNLNKVVQMYLEFRLIYELKKLLN